MKVPLRYHVDHHTNKYLSHETCANFEPLHQGQKTVGGVMKQTGNSKWWEFTLES